MRKTSLYRFARPAFIARANEIARSLSSSGRALLYALSALIIGSAAGILLLFNNAFLVSVPEPGGSLSEGIIGSPRFINPVLAIDLPDKDLTALVYSGLFKNSPGGNPIPDLASGYELTQGGRTYTVHLRPDAAFQDGTPVTASDVQFTIEKALDPALKSPLMAGWQGVAVNVIDPHTISFTLPQPYAPFLSTLTMGILPQHLWRSVSGQEFPFNNLNTMPVGSGPYHVIGINRSSSGAANSYDLAAFDKYALGAPYLTHLTVKFYPNEDQLLAGLESGEIDSASGISPASLSKLNGFAVQSAPLNRVFGVFFDQNNNPALQDLAVRKALSDAVDRQGLINDALGGYGAALVGPLPPSLQSGNSSGTLASTSAPEDRVKAAQLELQNAGWTIGQDGILEKSITIASPAPKAAKSGKSKAKRKAKPAPAITKTLTLAFTISTSDVPELKAAALELARTWSQLGAKVDVQVYAASDLSENVIRPRKYDALLFGEIVGRSADLYAFWDSKERNDPGLNIALYANSKVDAELEKLRQGNTPPQDELAQLSDEIAADYPAVFLYSPDFIYVVPKDLKGIKLGTIENPSDRFATINEWYRATDHIWKIFANQK